MPAKKPAAKKPTAKPPVSNKPGNRRQETKPPTPKKPKDDKPKKDEAPTDLINQVGSDFEAGKGLFDKYFNFGNLPQLQDQYAKENENLLSLRGAYADPNNASYAGRRSTDVQDILNRMKGGLEGYTAAENANIFERMNRDINMNLTNELKNIEETNAGNMVLGAAATARADAARRQSQKQRDINAQDLLIKNIDEKRSRLNDYGQTIRGAEADEYGRGQDAINAYEGTLGSLGQQSTNRQMYNTELDMKNRNAIAAGIGGFADIISNRRQQNTQNRLMDRFYKNREI